jgi:ubiquinone/menaquinone biosynthesis C-methylase UbiE
MFFFGRRNRQSGTILQETKHQPFTLLGGRRFVSDAPYVLPKDLKESDRLNFQHYLLCHAFRGLYRAPIRHPEAVLDVGTGSGRWAVEMAQRFPNANIIAIDIKPPPSTGVQFPQNMIFTEANVVTGLPFADNSFDFVHQRMLMGALPAKDWQRAVSELVRVTKRGGWIQLLEGMG